MNDTKNITEFTSFHDIEEHLNRLGLFHMDMGLGRVQKALQALDCTFKCPVVQVVGTNGKGSSATFLHSLAQAHGLKAALYTSPHFLSPKERIRLGTRLLPEAAWPCLANRVHAAAPDLTYFEFLTVLAAVAYHDASPDLIILEAGLGGQFDATSALPANLVCFTPIALDHQAILGPTIAAIAADKAMALRPGCTGLSAAQQPEAMKALRQRAANLQLPFYEISSRPGTQGTPTRNSESAQASKATFPNAPTLADLPPKLGLMGSHQPQNALLALGAWRWLCHSYGWPSNAPKEAQGLAQAFIPGRMQWIHLPGLPPLLLDGAHNTHGLKALLQSLKAEGLQPHTLLFSCMADKDMENMLPLVQALAPIRMLTTVKNERSARGEDLAAAVGGTAVPSLEEALHLLKKMPQPTGTEPASFSTEPASFSFVLICGSLYLLAEFFQLFPEFLLPAQNSPEHKMPFQGIS